ncbi:hypothetical protein Tco_1240099 [Tanacetum coccineum]
MLNRAYQQSLACLHKLVRSISPSVNKSESARSDTEEDVEAYMDERVDEPSSEEFQMGSIPQGSAPAKIVKWQILKTGKKGAYQIIREDHTDVGDLKTMFDPPSIEDAVWSLTHQQKVLSWRYFHSCAVHCLTLEAAHIYMLTEVKYPLPSRVCQAMLEKRLIGDRKDEEAHNEDTQRNLKFTSEDQVRGGLLGIIVNRLKSGSYRVKSGRHNNIDARNSEMESESAQDYFVLPIWSSYTSMVKSSEAMNEGEKSIKNAELKTNEKSVDQEDQTFLDGLERFKRAARASSTNTFNTASTPVSTASPSSGLSFTHLTNTDLDDSEIPDLEDSYDNPNDGIFTNASYDDEGAVADFTNLETVMNVSPIPTSRINSIHPLT